MINLEDFRIRRRDRAGGVIHEYEQVAQVFGTLNLNLDDAAATVKFLIRDRGSDFTAAFDTVLADAGIRTVLCNVRTPRMNAIMDAGSARSAANS